MNKPYSTSSFKFRHILSIERYLFLHRNEPLLRQLPSKPSNRILSPRRTETIPTRRSWRVHLRTKKPHSAKNTSRVARHNTRARSEHLAFVDPPRLAEKSGQRHKVHTHSLISDSLSREPSPGHSYRGFPGYCCYNTRAHAICRDKTRASLRTRLFAEKRASRCDGRRAGAGI